MFKKLALAILTPAAVKIVSNASAWIGSRIDNYGVEKENLINSAPTIIEHKPKRKSPDNTKFSSLQCNAIHREFLSYSKNKITLGGYRLKNTKELADYLNGLFDLNKSRTSYAKIWNSKK